MKIGLQFAMPAEFHALPGAKDMEPFQIISGVPFYNVAPDLIACAGGIGKVNAAMACEILCLSFGVEMVVNAGVAGCMTDLPTGTLVVPSDYVQHDMDTSAIGDAPGFVSTVNRLEFPTWRPERCLELLRAAGVDASTGRAATGDWFATGTGRATWIRDTFHPLLMDMEGCAIAQVCCRNGTPFVALKSVSDHLFRAGQVEEYFDFGQAIKNLGEVLLPLALSLQNERL
ncbi:MAG: 5'-methylthioadenosine/S-adenosylhomocysteine nucleosidase [Oscillibacter sp.]|nr:5'-methylthioadenosine/S-adenosylhomocysteine nucleosidase [Oscillibacter sp.]